MLTQPHLLLNTSHPDSSSRNTARSSYTRAKNKKKRAPRLDSSSRESRVCFFFSSSSSFSYSFPLVVFLLLLSLHITLSSFALSNIPLCFSLFLPSNVLPLFPQSPLAPRASSSSSLLPSQRANQKRVTRPTD